jgi:hypothetical protein
VEELEKRLEPKPPMLTVHLRRTDKKDDTFGTKRRKARTKLNRHETRTSMNETMVVIRALIRAAERLSGLQFNSIFLMSDEPGAFSAESTNYLSSALLRQTKPKLIFNDFVQTSLANHTDYLQHGHSVLGKKEHAMMDRELVASMIFVSRHASYLVGYGRSGVSQVTSHLLGAQHRMCPSTLSLFEDDLILLDHLVETKDWLWLLA